MQSDRVGWRQTRRSRWQAAMQRLGSTWVVTALGLLVVLGLSALVVTNVRTALAAQQDARRAEAAARVTGDAIALFTAVQIERGSAELLAVQQTEASRARFRGAADRTDLAITALRGAWVEARELLAAMGPPTIAEVLAATQALGEIRAAAVAPGGESTFDLYVSIVDMTLDTMQALGGVAANGDQLAESNGLTALLRAMESLGRERALVAEVLARGGDLSPEEAVRLSLLERDFQASAQAAQGLLPDRWADEIAAVVAGPAAEQAEALRRALEIGGPDGETTVDPQAWFREASGRVDGLAAVAVAVSEDLEAGAAADVRRARQALLLRSLGLGALLLVAIAAAGGAAFASVERVRALDEYAELAGGLQRWFLPETLPEVAGLRFAARYRPASERTRAGGDWYDSYLLGPQRVALVIGDVAGHGPQAGAQMAEVRNLLRGQASAYPRPPGEQVELLEATLPGSVFATLLIGVLDLETGTFTYSRAGHVPPLLAGANGHVAVLDGGTGPPVGTGMVAPRKETSVAVAPGSVLVFYTDGLVESRRHDLAAGIGMLVEALPGAGTELEALADAVLASRPDTANEDDIAVLLVRWER